MQYFLRHVAASRMMLPHLATTTSKNELSQKSFGHGRVISLFIFSREKEKREALIVLFCVGDIVIRRGRLTLEPTSANVEPADHVSGVSHHHRL
jgi:hypothetical protein